ncbi:hypothetical protein, partial [Burkholderia thailandensis]|uniref:hypothetical protein n=1 Tax=Burkholderia thailandensis TaxID=57975 RepID=UPI0021C9DA7D
RRAPRGQAAREAEEGRERGEDIGADGDRVLLNSSGFNKLGTRATVPPVRPPRGNARKTKPRGLVTRHARFFSQPAFAAASAAR